jgi:hypothetical protein
MRYRLELAALRSDERTLPNCLVGMSGDQGLRIDAVLASVADPEHTHLGLLTDRAINAIQAGAADAGYNPYSHFLPWASSDGQRNREDNSSGKAEAASHDPGLLIFRKDEPKTVQARYLAVFLISESPTTGLDQESFFAAHRIIDAIAEQTNPPKTEVTSHVVLFAGPSFSGSVGSLGDIDSQLERVARTEKIYRTHCIHAFSGMVTAATYSADKAACQSELVLAQTPDSDALALFVQGMQASYGYRSCEIAVLSEEGTAYGNSAVGGNAESVDADPSCNGILSLQFPREISKLRNAYGAVASQPSATTAQTGQEADVQMSWEDSQAARGDDVPTYGGQQTPLSQEAVLSNLAIAVKARQIKALGILATDPMDEAFLIRTFRKSSPDVRLFLRDPDLLYLRTPDVGSLNGTLLVNNYPMILRNQVWSRDPKQSNDGGNDRLVTLSSSEQEGQYDAFLLVLQAMGIKFPDGSNNPPLLEWNWPAGKSRPPEATVPTTKPYRPHPLWLTTIGTTGHFPLAILNVDQSVGGSRLDPQTLELGDPRFTGLLLWTVFVMLALAHVWGLSWPDALPRLLSDDFDLGDATDTITASKAVCHVGMLLILGLIQFVVGSSFVFFRHVKTAYAWLAGAVILITAILAATAVVVLLVRVAWPCWQARGQTELRNDDILSIKRPLFNGIFTVAIFATVGTLWVRGVFQQRFDSAFLHYRDLILAGGVAPCLPIVLLLLVAYLGVWCYLRRLTYWGYRRPQMPVLPLDDVFPSNFEKKIDAIDRCILVFLQNRGWALGFCLLFVLGVIGFRLPTTMEMIETPQVRWMAQTLFVVAFLVLALNWFRFINIWSLLRYILQGLERLPIRHAFERMPSEKSMPIWGWGLSDNSFLPTTQGVERLRALVREEPNAVDALSVADLKSKISLLGRFEERRKGIWALLFLLLRKQQPALVELSRAVGGSRAVVVEGGWNSFASRSVPNRLGRLLIDARDAMLEVANQLIRFLSPDYWRRGSDGSKEEGPPKPELRAFVLAEDLVAMRYYTYIRYVVTELRNLLFFVAMAFSLLFLAFHAYAFRADQAIDWSFMGLFLILGVGVTVVLYQMELDPILSHFGGTQAGEVGWSFYLNLLKYGAVPFLTIIGSQVPAVSNLLLRWVQPTLQSLR